jgi:hypothetical protein
MGVTRSNLKPIVKGSGRYHEIRWNVAFSCVMVSGRNAGFCWVLLGSIPPPLPQSGRGV